MDLKNVEILINLYLITNKQANKYRNILPFIKLKLEYDVLLFENLLEYYRKSESATNKNILGCIFAEKLVLEKVKVATPVFTEPVKLILRISEVLRSSKKKQEVDFDLLCLWVPPMDKNCNRLSTLFMLIQLND